MPKATLYRDLDRLDASHAGAVIAIGNFDGVHLGHQALIRQARAMADEMNAPLGILLFDQLFIFSFTLAFLIAFI